MRTPNGDPSTPRGTCRYADTIIYEMGNIQDFLELERLDYVSYIEDANAKLEKEIKSIKAKHSAQGVLLSGGTITGIAELRASHGRSLIEARLLNRRKYGALCSELFSDEYLTRLETECYRTVEALGKTLQSPIFPGLPAIKLGDRYTRPLQLIIAREIKKLRLERDAGTTPTPSRPPDSTPQDFFWKILHPVVLNVAKTRFEAGHYADAVEAALKEVNEIVREIVKAETGKELDGSDLMNAALSVKTPIITLDDISTVSGRNIQVGYM